MERKDTTEIKLKVFNCVNVLKIKKYKHFNTYSAETESD